MDDERAAARRAELLTDEADGGERQLGNKADRPGLVGRTLGLDDPATLPGLASETCARFPDPNVLVANAGVSRTVDTAAEDWNAFDVRAIVDANVSGVLDVVAAFLPVLERGCLPTGRKVG